MQPLPLPANHVNWGMTLPNTLNVLRTGTSMPASLLTLLAWKMPPRSSSWSSCGEDAISVVSSKTPKWRQMVRLQTPSPLPLPRFASNVGSMSISQWACSSSCMPAKEQKLSLSSRERLTTLLRDVNSQHIPTRKTAPWKMPLFSGHQTISFAKKPLLKTSHTHNSWKAHWAMNSPDELAVPSSKPQGRMCAKSHTIKKWMP